MKSDYRDHYYGSILDPLHGDIKLSEIEKWCLAQPIFARLRYVKQNTFLYYVFPSANHTRFEHSIGVMHMAGKIFDSVKENFATGEKKRLKYGQKSDSFFDINKLGELEPLYYQELRLAGLLHDVGHGPMSHLFDDFSISSEVFLRIVKEDSALSGYSKGFEQWVNHDQKVEHEILSCAFIFYLIASLKSVSEKDQNKFSASTYDLIARLSAERIVRMIAPGFEGLSQELVDHYDNNYGAFFSKIITAFPIDADRMDYLIRDSYFTGVTYGVYDLNRVYSSFQAKRDDNKVELVFKESGIDSMLRFIQSRTHLYNQVYFHKTNRAVNTMLGYATRTIRSSQTKLLDKCKNLSELISFYTDNSDDFFVKRTIRPKLQGIELEVLQDLIDRKLFKRVLERKIVLAGEDPNLQVKRSEIKIIRNDIRNKLYTLTSESIYAEVDFYENNTFKDADSKNVALARKSLSKQKQYEFIYNWAEAGTEFKRSNMVVSMIRIYVKRTFHSANEYESMAKRILETVEEEVVKLDKFI